MHCESVNEMAILPELAAARPAGVDRRAWPGLTVVKQRQSPVMTTIEEFHEVGPGSRARTPSVRSGSPVTFTSALPVCRPASWPRPPR